MEGRTPVGHKLKIVVGCGEPTAVNKSLCRAAYNSTKQLIMKTKAQIAAAVAKGQSLTEDEQKVWEKMQEDLRKDDNNPDPKPKSGERKGNFTDVMSNHKSQDIISGAVTIVSVSPHINRKGDNAGQISEKVVGVNLIHEGERKYLRAIKNGLPKNIEKLQNFEATIESGLVSEGEDGVEYLTITNIVVDLDKLSMRQYLAFSGNMVQVASL